MQKAHSHILSNLQKDFKQLSDCLRLCRAAAGTYNLYPFPQRDAWFASHLLHALLFSLRLELSIILFLALIPIAFNYICLRVRALHMRNKEIGGAHFFIPLPQDRGGLVCQSNFLRLACPLFRQPQSSVR